MPYKRKRRYRDVEQEALGDVSREMNAETIKNALWCAQLPVIDKSDPEQVKNRVLEYMHHCIDTNTKPGMEGMCNSLHVSKAEFNHWVSGKYRRELQPVAAWAKQILAELLEQYLMSGQVFAPAAIFLLSNGYGYMQKTTQIIENEPVTTENRTPEQIADRYSGSVIDVQYEEHKDRIKIPENSSAKGIQNLTAIIDADLETAEVEKKD